MPLETKAYFSFEIQSSVGIQQGSVPATPLDSKVCQCSSALIGPPYLWVLHPQVQPSRVFDWRLIESSDVNYEYGGLATFWDMFCRLKVLFDFNGSC